MRRVGHLVVCGAVILFLGAGKDIRSAEKRLLKVDDLFEIKDVNDPQVSPEGDWVAYTVRKADSKTDKNDTDIYMTRWTGRRPCASRPARSPRRRRASAPMAAGSPSCPAAIMTRTPTRCGS